jgi:hypothetical protein
MRALPGPLRPNRSRDRGAGCVKIENLFWKTLRAFSTAEIMDGWDVVLWAIAGYVATVALVRLMINRRNELVGDLVEEAEKKRQEAKKPSTPPSSPRPKKVA